MRLMGAKLFLSGCLPEVLKWFVSCNTMRLLVLLRPVVLTRLFAGLVGIYLRTSCSREVKHNDRTSRCRLLFL